jgi:hypothetical protein
VDRSFNRIISGRISSQSIERKAGSFLSDKNIKYDEESALILLKMISEIIVL